MKENDPVAEAFMPLDDALGEALHSLRMSGTFYCRSELTAPWSVDLPGIENSVMFHVVTSGKCWIEVEGTEPRLLRAGDFALVPHGKGHVITSDRSLTPVDLFDLPRELLSERYEILRYGGGGEQTTLVCGAVCFDHPAARRVVSMLPKIITIEATSPDNEWILSSIRFMVAEAKAMRPGGETIITRVSDILVIQAIRSWLEENADAQTGWLAALRDKQIGRAIALVHRDPMQPWTVALLAERTGMSRSAFSARFTSLVGEPPMHYVRRWRMQVAVTWLKESDEPIGEIAERLDYRSEAAFNRAFKKFIGATPGAVRRAAA